MLRHSDSKSVNYLKKPIKIQCLLFLHLLALLVLEGNTYS